MLPGCPNETKETRHATMCHVVHEHGRTATSSPSPCRRAVPNLPGPRVVRSLHHAIKSISSSEHRATKPKPLPSGELPNLHITETVCTVLFSSSSPIWPVLQSEVTDREGRTGTIPGCAASSCAPSEHDRPSKFRASIVEESHSTHPAPYVARPPMWMRISNTVRPSHLSHLSNGSCAVNGACPYGHNGLAVNLPWNAPMSMGPKIMLFIIGDV